MKRCSRCAMPDTRPDTPFVDGLCPACAVTGQQIDWTARRRDLERLLERGRNDSGYDCIVASSGGKDSHAQVLDLLDMGARPLLVTATTCHPTALGEANIDNLSRYADTREIRFDREVRAKLNRLGLQLVGDISWPEHAAIFTTPLRVAAKMGIPLVFYGENPQRQYGGPPGSEQARQLTRRWTSEFGGFLGLRPADLVGVEGLTAADLEPYTFPEDLGVAEAHFLGEYLGPWDSHRNAERAIAAGMQYQLPSEANWWPWENLDNAQTGLHDLGMWFKYNFGRATAQVSVDVRTGRLTRDEALQIVQEREGKWFDEYAGVPMTEVVERIGMTIPELISTLKNFACKNSLEAWNRGPGPAHHSVAAGP